MSTVAVITRTKNRPSYLARALRSVSAQGVGDLVHVIVNDGGERSAIDAALAHAKPQHSVQLEHVSTSMGRGAAANLGLERSQSTLVVFHDDDDTWHPAFLRTAIERWRSSKRRGVITAAERVIERDEGGDLTELRREPFFPTLRAISLADVARESCFVNLAFLAERSAVHEVGGYDPELPVYEDWDFNLRFLSRFDVAFVPQVLAFYHQRETASGSARNSFDEEAAKSADARAVLVNRWLRKGGTVGLLMALGPASDAVMGTRDRLDKLFNLVHSARHTWPLSAVESWLSRGQ